MYKIQAFITEDILKFYKRQEYPKSCKDLKYLLTTDNFTCGSFAFTFLTHLVEDESIDSYLFLTNIYDHISKELRDKLDSYFETYTKGEFNGTSYENSKLLDVLKLLPKKSKLLDELKLLPKKY